MKKLKNKKGITLIALVVTIVVLLILAGTAIAMLTGDDGIIKNAQNAKEETQKASDKEQIQLLISENLIEEHIIGEKLKQIEFNTTENTKSIYDSETGKTYGEGWYYLTPGNAEELQLQKSYIVNYETGEIIEFDETKHKIVTNELKCVTDGLVYAADPQNMTDGNNWGNAILHNFNKGDANSGWKDNALMFDGIDDGIEVKDASDYSNGITLEMYFSFRGKTENQLAQILMMKRNTVIDGFFMYIDNGSTLYGEVVIDIGGSRFRTGFIAKENTPIYVTYTFNPKAKFDKGILYINGKKNQTTEIGNIANLIKVQENTNIQIGSDIYKTNEFDGDDNRYPLNGEIYAARVYNRALTDKEVEYNYNATKLETQ